MALSGSQIDFTKPAAPEPSLGDVRRNFEHAHDEIIDNQNEIVALRTRLENLGQYAGAFDTRADVPDNVSGFPGGVSVNDFVTVRADETRGGTTTRYVVTAIADPGGVITWTYDVTYSTDISGKMDLVPAAAAGNLAAFDSAGQAVDAGVSATSIRQGVAGSYTQGAAFTAATMQAWLDDNINNRWFDGSLHIYINQPITSDIVIHNVTLTYDNFIILYFSNTSLISTGSLTLSKMQGTVSFQQASRNACGTLRLTDCTQVDFTAASFAVYDGFTEITANRVGRLRFQRPIRVNGLFYVGVGVNLQIMEALTLYGQLSGEGEVQITHNGWIYGGGTINLSGHVYDRRTTVVGWGDSVELFARKTLLDDAQAQLTALAARVTAIEQNPLGILQILEEHIFELLALLGAPPAPDPSSTVFDVGETVWDEGWTTFRD
jgi:hypothetical protein